MDAKMQLKTLIATMFARGMLDDQFQQLQMLQDMSAPNFIAEIITIYSEEGERVIHELAKLLDKPCVDFNKVIVFAHQLKGSSASIGAQRVNNSCSHFLDVCQEKSRDGCMKTLDVVRNNFYDVRNKFMYMLQLEQQAQTFYPKHSYGTTK